MITMNPLTQFKKTSILPLLIALAPIVVAGSAGAAVSDFNGDGHPDYVLYNLVTRQTAIWYLNNNVFLGARYGPTLPAGWQLAGVADFNRDGHPDYVLQNASTHQTAIWYLNNNVRIASALGPTLPSGWFLGAVGDFNADGKPDYLLYKPGSNFPAPTATAIWYLNNNVRIGSALGPTLPSGWVLKGVEDFNGDGKPDFLLYDFSSGDKTAIWYLSGAAFARGVSGPTLAPGYTLGGAADFNGDGKPDYVLIKFIGVPIEFRTQPTAIWYLNNNVFIRAAYGPTLPPGWNLVAPFAGGPSPWDY
jgi:hypothetical protein